MTLSGNFPAEYVLLMILWQRGALFFHAISDDEKFGGKDERLLGDDCDADGRQLDENDLPVVTPNALPTLLEVFSYYFINAIVTVSAVIFIAGARTMVITTKIKEL